MNTNKANFISNVIRSLWSLLSIYLFVPVYIKILGVEAYGLVSFYTTLQATLNILGFGLSNSLRREFVKETCNHVEDVTYKFNLLRSVETIYLFIGFVIVLLCLLFSSILADKWLNLSNLSIKTVSIVIVIMSISIALNFETNLWLGCLYGLNYQFIGNIYYMTWLLAKITFSIGLTSCFYNSIVAFYSGQILADLLYALFLRAYLKSKLICDPPAKWKFGNFAVLKNIWKYTIGIFIISIIATVNTEFDKLIISKIFSLIELGAYNTAISLANATNILPSAATITIFSVITNKISLGKHIDAVNSYLEINKTITIFTVCLGCFLAIYAVPIIEFWTNSKIYTKILISSASYIIFAKMLLNLQQMPYAMALANGNTKINILISIIFLPITISLTYLMIINNGIKGAAIAGFILMTFQSLIYIYCVTKQYINTNALSMISLNILPCLLISLFVAYSSFEIIKNIFDDVACQCGVGFIIGIITLACLLILFDSNVLLTIKQIRRYL